MSRRTAVLPDEEERVPVSSPDTSPYPRWMLIFSPVLATSDLDECYIRSTLPLARDAFASLGVCAALPAALLLAQGGWAESQQVYLASLPFVALATSGAVSFYLKRTGAKQM